MPIYAYRCDSCGHAKDVIQKFSDTPLSVCPECGADAFRKQLTAPSFQLKGSGWYVTDFRDKGGKAEAPAKAAESSPESGAAASGDGAANVSTPSAPPAPSSSSGGPSESSASATPAKPQPST